MFGFFGSSKQEKDLFKLKQDLLAKSIEEVISYYDCAVKQNKPNEKEIGILNEKFQNYSFDPGNGTIVLVSSKKFKALIKKLDTAHPFFEDPSISTLKEIAQSYHTTVKDLKDYVSIFMYNAIILQGYINIE